MLYYVILFCTTLYYTILYYTVPYFTVLFYTVYYTILWLFTVSSLSVNCQLRSRVWRGFIQAGNPYKGGNCKWLGWTDSVKQNYWFAIDDDECFSLKTFGVIRLLLWLWLCTVSPIPVNWQLPVSLAGCGVASYAQGSYTRVEMAVVDGPGETSGEAITGLITNRWRRMFYANVTQT